MLERAVSQYIGDGSSPGRGHRFETLHPGTGAPLATVIASHENDIDQAVSLARAAQKSWAKVPSPERGRILTRAAQLLRQQNERLARWETLDTGKPISESLSVDVLSAADSLEYFGSLAAVMQTDQISLPGAMAYTLREPIGVVGAIGAWNYPLQIAAWKAGPALACGNAVVFKPSELTPITAVELAKIFQIAGLPPGLFQVIQGGGDVGARLVSHPHVAKVSLTGSVATGKKVAMLAAEALKRVSLELGGKSPLVIFEDADLDEAMHGTLLANVFTQGEICSNGTRVFVHRKILPAFIDKLVAKVETLIVGDPLDMTTQIGALISADHRDKVLDFIRRGQAEGAELISGGQIPEWQGAHTTLAKGFYLTPAVFAGCGDEMSIVRDEIFGPVISVLGFDDENEVIARANDTTFGLAAGLFTRDIKRAHRMAHALEAGIVWINNYNITPVQVPFGGTKWSGMGRENGIAALNDYSQLKTVYVELDRVASPY